MAWKKYKESYLPICKQNSSYLNSNLDKKGKYKNGKDKNKRTRRRKQKNSPFFEQANAQLGENLQH